MKQDNRGITLMELMIAITITVVVMGAATLFIRTALKSYDAASNTIDLQMESQIVMEQISTWIMEGNKVKVIDGDTLVIYHIPRQIESSKFPSSLDSSDRPDMTISKRIIGVENGKLYMKVVSPVDLSTDADVSLTASDAVIENCIGEYVIEFTPTVDATNQDEVTVSMRLKEGTQEYELSNLVKIRNELRN